MRVCLSCYSQAQPCNPTDASKDQASHSMGFSRREYGSGLPCPVPGGLSNPGTPHLLCLLHGQADASLAVTPGKPIESSCGHNTGHITLQSSCGHNTGHIALQSSCGHNTGHITLQSSYGHNTGHITLQSSCGHNTGHRTLQSSCGHNTGHRTLQSSYGTHNTTVILWA